MWAPEVYHDPETNKLMNVGSAYHRSRGVTCTVCLTRGATVGCYAPSCHNVYHFCCLHGTPPPWAYPEANGPCIRHDNYYAAFCSAHSSNANDGDFMQQMMADAELSNLLSDRAAAVESALLRNTEQGRECPSFDATGLRRSETETIFCGVWGVSCVTTATSWVTGMRRPQRRLLLPEKRISFRYVPLRVPRTALGVITGAICRSPCGRSSSRTAADAGVSIRPGSGTRAVAADRGEVGSRPGALAPAAREAASGTEADERDPMLRTGLRPPVFLLRNMRQSREVG